MTSLESPDDLKRAWLLEEGADVSGSKDAKLTITTQCELLGIVRTSIYRKHTRKDTEREDRIKTRIDYWHTLMPYMGARKLRNKLKNDDKELI